MNAGKTLKILALLAICAVSAALICSCLVSVNDPDVTKQPENSPTAQTAGTDAPSEPTPDPEAVKARVNAFCGLVQGTWTAEDDSFVHFEDEEGIAGVMFAVWNAGGEFPAGTIADAEKIADGVYKLTVNMNDGSTAEYVCTVSGKEMILSSGTESKTYRYYDSRQLNGSTEINSDPNAFVSLTEGTWTSLDGRFLDFYFEDDGSPRVLFGSWIGGPGFVYATVTGVKETEPGTYAVTVQPDFFDSEITYTCLIDGEALALSAGEEWTTYIFLKTAQYPQNAVMLNASEALAVFEGPFYGVEDVSLVFYMEQIMGSLMINRGVLNTPEKSETAVVLNVIKPLDYENRYLADAQVQTADGPAIHTFVLEFDATGKILTVTEEDKAPVVYRKDDSAEASARAKAFAETYEGDWTATDLTFLEISAKGSEPVIMYAVWYSGGSFPKATIIDAKEVSSSGNSITYSLKLKDSSGEVFERECVYTKDTGMNSLDTLRVADETNVVKTYVKYHTYQPSGREDLDDKYLYAALGDTDGRYWKTSSGKIMRVGYDSSKNLTIYLKENTAAAEVAYRVVLVALVQPFAHSNYTVVAGSGGTDHIFDFVLYNLDTVAAVALDDPITGSDVYFEVNP